jgi:hypothetical protein
MFTAKRLMWVIKEHGESWNGEYFRQTVLAENVIPFLKRRENVLNVRETTFLPCMKAIATQQLLKCNNVDFFGNSEWPGASPDLNVCENVGSILKDSVDRYLQLLPKHTRNNKESLMDALNHELRAIEFDTDLFRALLLSYPARIAAVVQANGGQTEY